ncbi:mandelate racemase/muconate lactonizing enzyme family protein [Stratiformator vulcanicus]|uniref:Isomerase YitF n=1 Tax=Stratiformator vulcanicus TaxID=2527980 RepID=A0A517R2Z9_9PLAN|nr:mandelate racemase/muconate lactonizing enzyme family protein [Stratiformator vulcanicus]QDT38256.1 Putative isomerase YitF [Stratiformator vulcanicus]
MKIAAIEPIVLSIPFTAGGSGEGIMPTVWNTLDIVLVRVESDDGLIGWGEAFGYFCADATAAMIRRSVAPVLIGREFDSPEPLGEELQRKMVLQGRYGISTFAISGVDIALWDLKAKAEGVSLAELIGDRNRDSVPAYASLVRYGDSDLVAEYTEKAASQGYPEIKLHEITLPEIRCSHQVVGGEIPISVDVNCNWSVEFTQEVLPELVELKASWLEEPVFPPDDFRTLASLRGNDMPIAAGENACTAFQFAEMIRLGGCDLIQPSVTKVGGISEFLRVLHLNREAGLRLMPHSPYFGPGYLATLQLAAMTPSFELFEFLYIEPDAWLFPNMPLPEQGEVAIPDGTGLGIEPDADVIARYRIA